MITHICYRSVLNIKYNAPQIENGLFSSVPICGDGNCVSSAAFHIWKAMRNTTLPVSLN
jgi:hypothetical protein